MSGQMQNQWVELRTVELLMRILQATPEQQAAIEGILEGREPETRGQRAAVGGQQSAGSGQEVAPAAEPYISKAETAMRMGKDVRTITTYMSKGWLPHYKLGHTVVFKWSEVEKQLAAMCRVNRGRG